MPPPPSSSPTAAPSPRLPQSAPTHILLTPPLCPLSSPLPPALGDDALGLGAPVSGRLHAQPLEQEGLDRGGVVGQGRGPHRQRLQSSELRRQRLLTKIQQREGEWEGGGV